MGCGRSILPRNDSNYDKNMNFLTLPKITRLSIVPPETAAGCKTFMGQDYRGLAKQCREKGELFTDPTFPPDGRSLNFNGRQPTKVKWLRPGLFVEGISASDFDQGQLGNCWFIASCSCIAMQPWLVLQMIPDWHLQEWSSSNNYSGIFHFHFFVFGEWIDVTIDDLLPTKDGKLIYCQSTSRNEFWSALVEKAYAKLFGCYEALKSGMSNNAMEDLTGGVGEYITIPTDITPRELDYRKRAIFNDLRQTFRKHYLINASISSSADDVETKLSNGLVTGHSYSITDIRWIRVGDYVSGLEEDSVPMVRLRNPWGRIEWNGAWCDHSKEWEAIDGRQKSKLGLNLTDDGEFWMCFDDFFENFNKLYVCHLLNKGLLWKGRQCKGSFRKPDRAGGCGNFKTHIKNPQYLFEITENGTEVVIVLQQADGRLRKGSGRKDEHIGFRVYRVPAKAGTRLKKLPGKPVASSGTYSNTRSCIAKKKFKKGRYIILPSTFKPGIELEFLIRIYSTADPMLSEELSDNQTVTSSFNMRPVSQISNIEPRVASAPRRLSMAIVNTFQRSEKLLDTTITVHQCRGLGLGNQGSLCFYCEVACGNLWYRSDTYNRSFNPAWEFSATFYDRNPDDFIAIIVRNEAANDEIVGVLKINCSSEVTKNHVRTSALRESFTSQVNVMGKLFFTIEQERAT